MIILVNDKAGGQSRSSVLRHIKRKLELKFCTHLIYIKWTQTLDMVTYSKDGYFVI